MPIAEVRFYVGDTDTPYLLTDGQITLAIDNTSSDLAAAAMCARALAAKFSSHSDARFESVWSYDSQKAQAYERLARVLARQAERAGGLGLPLAGGISVAEMLDARDDPDRVPSSFRIGRFEHDQDDYTFGAGGT